MKDYYRVLRISHNASEEQIRKAFRYPLLSRHTDACRNGHRNLDDFIELREAYEALNRSEKREIYDSALRAYRTNRRRYRWKTVNGSSPNGQFQKHRHEPGILTSHPGVHSRGVEAHLINGPAFAACHRNRITPLKITLEQSITGFCLRFQRDHSSEFPSSLIRIPGKLWEGATIAVPGLGYKHPSSQAAGDLHILVTLAKHELLRLYGSNLYFDVKLKPWEAAGGTTIVIPTLQGRETIEIPPSLNGRSLRRLPNRGIYKKSGKRGDLWVNVDIEMAPACRIRAHSRLLPGWKADAQSWSTEQ